SVDGWAVTQNALEEESPWSSRKPAARQPTRARPRPVPTVGELTQLRYSLIAAVGLRHLVAKPRRGARACRLWDAPDSRPQRLNGRPLSPTKNPAFAGLFPVRRRGLEPPRTIRSTRPSTLRVY